jgi:hypothetical protein
MAVMRKTIKKGTTHKVSLPRKARARTATKSEEIETLLTGIERDGKALSASADKLLRRVF